MRELGLYTLSLTSHWVSTALERGCDLGQGHFSSVEAIPIENGHMRAIKEPPPFSHESGSCKDHLGDAAQPP